ncbi:MAG: arginine--tRNA ligase [Fimbriimonadales bacterium]|nr:arginine--tRNA ligase [Fimbriimonadales bacterium]
MIRDLVRSRIQEALLRLAQAGVPEAASFPPPEVSDTRQAEHGDYASNVALLNAKAAGHPPRALAERLAAELASAPEFEAVEVAGPGFLNFRLRPEVVAGFVGEILARGERLAESRHESPQRINVEFVSVNPNGPITVGSGRGAAFGSALCNVLEAAGHQVHREYYINDGVNSEQMRLFAESVRALILGEPLPEGGYKGDYVQAVADRVAEILSRPLEPAAAETRRDLEAEADPWRRHVLRRRLETLARVEAQRSSAPDARSCARALTNEDLKLLCESLMIERQRDDLRAFAVHFDTWFSEQSLHDAGEVERCLQRLVEAGIADTEPYQTVLKLGKNGEVLETVRVEQPRDDEDDDAPEGEAVQPTLWLRSTRFGDDKDRVLRRRDGRLTYIASDLAYHLDKFNRPPNADRLVTVLGPDHHGYIGRLTAVVAALLRHGEGEEADRRALEEARRRLQVVIFQIVRFVKDGEPAPMRKRDGNIYALIDLIEELGRTMAPEEEPERQRQVGKDVARFFYLMRSHDTHMDFDIDLATRRSDENPVFYVQYAHARICSVLRKASGAGFQPEQAAEEDLRLLGHPKELALVKKVADLPYEARRCADDFGVHRLTTYAVDLARLYHAFYDTCRVLQPENPALTRARLALCQAAALGLRGALGLLGVSAPERM